MTHTTPFRLALVATVLAPLLAASPVRAEPANQVLGTWRMISAEIERDGKKIPAYGKRPSGMLIFAPDMHYVEVLTDGDVPRFASNVRGRGTDEENRTAMATSIGMFGSYTVDKDGAFTGDRVEGSTFPNWIGDIRTERDLRIVVEGNRMIENFTRPDGTKIVIVLERAN